jgi:antitoxin CcdA
MESSMSSLVSRGRKTSQPSRHATNVTLPEDLLHAARALNINVSQACERGLAAEISAVKAQRWLVGNRTAITAWNAHVEQHGLPLAEFRQF